MGFGNYDESEQKNRPDGSDIETGETRGDAEHDGEVSVEGADDTEKLLSKLDDMN